MKGVNPAWANLPKRNCDDCGKKYKPKQPLREGMRGFCTDNCRKSYHKHGGAYRKLKVEMRKMVTQQFEEFHAALNALLYRVAALENRTKAPVPSASQSVRSPAGTPNR